MDLVDSVWIFDERKRLVKAMVWGVYELIHDEAAYTLSAQIGTQYEIMPGMFLGFYGIDGRFLMFEVNSAETDDASGQKIITATDAAIDELAHKVAPEIRMEKATAETGARAAIAGSGFEIGTVTTDGEEMPLDAYYAKRWKVLREIADGLNVRIVPYYEFTNGAITGKRVDVLKKTYTSRGRIIEGGGDAQVYVAYEGAPITRMYAIGAATGTDDPPTRVTIRDAVWKKADGDPADKPAGQDYIELPEGTEQYGWGREEVFEDKYEDNPGKLLKKAYDELIKRSKPAVTGGATLADLEWTPGHEHKKIRMYDTVCVRTRNGESAEGVVIGIKRNYKNPALTRITLGEDTPAAAQKNNAAKKIAALSESARRSGGSGAAAANRYIETKQLIQLNAELIQLNAMRIQLNATATEEQFKIIDEETNRKFAQVGIDMDALNAEMLLYAKLEYVDGTIDEVYVDLNAAEKKISLKADLIELNALKTVVDTLEADLIDTKLGYADYISTAALKATSMDAGNAAIGTLSVGGHSIDLQSIKVVTEVGTKERSAMAPSGTTSMTFKAVDYVKTDTIEYLDWD